MKNKIRNYAEDYARDLAYNTFHKSTKDLIKNDITDFCMVMIVLSIRRVCLKEGGERITSFLLDVINDINPEQKNK